MLPGSSFDSTLECDMPFKRPVVFWTMYVSLLEQNQRGNRLVSGLECHRFSDTWASVFQASVILRSLEDGTPFF